MKKLIVIVLTTILFAISCFNTFASENNSSSIIIDNIEVIFDSSSSLSTEDKQLIAEQLANENSTVQTYGLFCNLFGHKYTTEMVVTITHCVNPTSPRCLQERWEVSKCSRCDNTEQTLLSQIMIDCCPSD